jgi:hypothetical protein
MKDRRSVMRGIDEYVSRYKQMTTEEGKTRINKEASVYLANVTRNDDEFLFYASEFVCRCHKKSLLERLKDWSKA